MSEKKISLKLASDEPTEVVALSREDGGDVMTEIRKEVQDHPIVLYMKGTPEMPMCGFSARAAAILSSYRKPIYAVNVLQDPEKREAIKVFSEWPTIPQVYIKGEFIGGSDILTQLYESGELESLLEGI